MLWNFAASDTDVCFVFNIVFSFLLILQLIELEDRPEVDPGIYTHTGLFAVDSLLYEVTLNL